MLDSHIHIMSNEAPQSEKLSASLARAGMTGGYFLSPPPASFAPQSTAAPSAEIRLQTVLNWCAGKPDWFPALWLDPLDPDAGRQVDMAVQAGIAGFKIICTHCDPGHPSVVRIAARIAETNRPVLFHSGILWNGGDSSRYNRPAGFEALLQIRNLRFAMAHASWPWIDECLAVYGKFQHARRQDPDSHAELFLDLTPGTPRIYREELYRKLLGIGYAVADHILFGMDHLAEDYSAEGTLAWLETDRQLMRQFNAPEDGWNKLTELNLRRFIGRHAE